MSYRRRIYFTSAQKSEIWDRWQRGESMSSIGRGFDRESSSIYPLLSRTGGIRPAGRRRSRFSLTLVEREEISRGLETGSSFRSIARQLCRSASTISREVKRNGGCDAYRAVQSDQAAWDRAHRPKLCKLACNPALSRTISRKLQLNWSPEQIAGWLKREYRGAEHNPVSHETIYRSLFVQARGVLKKELMQYLRSKRTIRRSRHASLKRDGLGQIKDAVSISERPACVEDRAVPGQLAALRQLPPTAAAPLAAPGPGRRSRRLHRGHRHAPMDGQGRRRTRTGLRHHPRRCLARRRRVGRPPRSDRQRSRLRGRRPMADRTRARLTPRPAPDPAFDPVLHGWRPRRRP